MRLLFAVHRYYPFPGGSETNVRRLAEQAVVEGHEATVLADRHQGDVNGVRVTSDYQVMFGDWDMIIVHGSCPTQDTVISWSPRIKSPIYYLIVQPAETTYALAGLQVARWIGCGTSFDWAHVERFGVADKGRPFVYGIPLDETMGAEGFREAFGITTSRMFVSAGGFWPHKRMQELVRAFRESSVPDTTLVLLGYDTSHGSPPPQSDTVKCIIGAPERAVYDAMYEADLYIMNSDSEGYGLVLLEAMNNCCPWIARDIAGAHDLQEFGTVYSDYGDLVALLRTFDPNPEKIDCAVKKVIRDHTVADSLRSILSVLD